MCVCVCVPALCVCVCVSVYPPTLSLSLTLSEWLLELNDAILPPSCISMVLLSRWTTQNRVHAWGVRGPGGGAGGGGGGGGGAIAVTSREAPSDLRQISAEMSRVHPLVTVACDSSALAGFNSRSTPG